MPRADAGCELNRPSTASCPFGPTATPATCSRVSFAPWIVRVGVSFNRARGSSGNGVDRSLTSASDGMTTGLGGAFCAEDTDGPTLKSSRRWRRTLVGREVTGHVVFGGHKTIDRQAGFVSPE